MEVSGDGTNGDVTYYSLSFHIRLGVNGDVNLEVP